MNAANPPLRKTAKVSMNSVRIRETTLEHLTRLADAVGKNSASGLAGEVLEAMADMKPENYHLALADFIKAGRK